MEWICGNDIAEIGGKKKFLQLACGNAIVEIGKNKFVAIMAMPLPKIGGKKIVVAEFWGGIKKKVLRPQYFYNIFTTNHK